MKTLVSGLQVNADKYYQLLEWKDTHSRIFERWVFERGLGALRSINNIQTMELYDDLLHIANIK